MSEELIITPDGEITRVQWVFGDQHTSGKAGYVRSDDGETFYTSSEITKLPKGLFESENDIKSLYALIGFLATRIKTLEQSVSRLRNSTPRTSRPF